MVEHGKPMVGRFSAEVAELGLPDCHHCGTQMVLAGHADEELRKAA